ncbi:MAG: aldo/keto reductase, partial [Chloroflexota bacterium]|nr:aldo/keto reductase [Chloroflexota bacterium]
LHRLQTDYIDLYQCHIREHPRHDVFLEAFERLLEAGKIRAYGTSSFIPSEIEFFDSHGRCQVAQIPYSVLERTYETDALPLCHERNIGVLVRGPLGQGVLAGKFPPDHQFTDPTRTGWNTGDAQQRFQERRAAAEALRPMSGEGRSMAQVALAFAIAHPANTCAIPGARSPEQVRANAEAADLTLTDDELATLRTIAPPA